MAVVDQNGLKSNTVTKEVLIGFSYPVPPPEKWKSPETHKLGHIFFEFLKDREFERRD
jgi:hypothetical protein